MNILQELFYGNIDPNTNSFDRVSDFGKNMKIISENEEKFINGFRLGSLMMIEILKDQRGLLLDGN